MEIFKDENFPIGRYKHCYRVGKKMYDYALNNLHWSKEKAQEMFVLGNLHDIGYEFDGDSFRDGWILSERLKESNYKYFNEVRFHAKLQKEYMSNEMDLLYFADLTVDGIGNYVTFDERMEDLINRYGKDSEVVKDSYDIIEYLKEKGYSDDL